MYYTDDALQQLADGYASVNAKFNDLQQAYVHLDLRNPRASEFAHQGFPRRLKVMVRCITNVFEGIPPKQSDLPTQDALNDATINIQSFVFNTFGAIDNLAWIWVCENGQRLSDGTSIPDRHVGLGPRNTTIRGTLSRELQEHLMTMDAWFAYLADLRHALAHRIPLYIPPYVVDAKDLPAYKAFEARMRDAVLRGEFDIYDRLSAEQLTLGRFRPWIQHSFQEEAVPIVFHAQMLADFNTVEDLGRKMLEQLDPARMATRLSA